MRLLDGARVWVVGSSSGVGAAAARLAAEAGARVVLTARRQPELHALAAQLPSPGRHLVVASDLVREDDVRLAAERIEAAFGGLDAVVQTAGVGLFGDLCDASDEDARLVVETNLLGVVRVVRHAVPLLEAGGPPRAIALLGSAAGRRGERGLSVYAASKGALFPLADALREELAPKGVRVTLLAPGPIDTDFVTRSLGRPPRPASGLSPEAVARALLASLLKGPPVRSLPRRQGLRALLNVIAPSLFDRLRRR